MRRQIAVGDPKIGEPVGQQLEMASLFGGDADPVVEKCTRQFLAREPRDEIPAEVDRVELDMSESVKERDPAGHGAERPALGHLFGRAQQWTFGPGRAGRRRRPAQRCPALLPAVGESPARCGLGGGVGGGEDRRRLAGGSAAARQDTQRARAGFSTSSTLAGTRTLCQTPRMMPVPSIRKVARSMPMYLRPYMLFSTHTPYFSHTSPPVSEARRNGSPCFFLNLSCEATESFDMPMTTAPAPP